MPHRSTAFLSHGHFAHLSVWQPLLADLTFATEYLDLSQADSRALLKLIGISRQLSTAGQEGEQEEESLDVLLSLLPPSARSQLEDLSIRVGSLLSAWPGAFLRLDTRSPKDGVFKLPRLKAEVRKRVVDRHFTTSSSEECESYDSACVHRAIIAAQEICSGTEALELLRRSQRVEADLVLGQVANLGDASSRLVLRKWDSRIDPLCEVRAFVCQGRVTAITQYYATCLVPQLRRERDNISRLVCDTVAEVDNRIGHLVPIDDECLAPFYVVDLALISDPGVSHFTQALLIEINPPPPISGTVLFDYSRDRMQLTSSSSGLPALRLVERPVPWHSVPFHPPIKELVDELRGRKGQRRFCCRRRWH